MCRNEVSRLAERIVPAVYRSIKNTLRGKFTTYRYIAYNHFC